MARISLPPLIVTAGRVDQKLGNVPHTLIYIDAKAFTDGGRRSLPEALEHVPGVLVQYWNTFDPWSLSGFLAWQDSRVKNEAFLGGPESSAPASRQLPLSGSVALRWADDADKIWIEGRLLAAAREDRFTAADQAADNQRIPTGGTPGYLVVSLHGGWKLSDHLTLTAGLENLTDTDYRNHGSGQNHPGFNAILGATVRW